MIYDFSSTAKSTNPVSYIKIMIYLFTLALLL